VLGLFKKNGSTIQTEWHDDFYAKRAKIVEVPGRNVPPCRAPKPFYRDALWHCPKCDCEYRLGEFSDVTPSFEIVPPYRSSVLSTCPMCDCWVRLYEPRNEDYVI
jgi:hypothetical protein